MREKGKREGQRERTCPEMCIAAEDTRLVRIYEPCAENTLSLCKPHYVNSTRLTCTISTVVNVGEFPKPLK